MTELLDSSGLRVALYLVVGAVALATGLREYRFRRPDDPALWPTYWFLSAALLLIMGIARWSGLGDLASDIGRDQARSGGWYDTRRGPQAVAVLSISAIWAASVFTFIWRVPLRRRLYLPNVVATATLLAFAAVRLISLHQIDAVLYRRSIRGVRLVAPMEILLLLATLATIVWSYLSARRVRFVGSVGIEPTTEGL